MPRSCSPSLQTTSSLRLAQVRSQVSRPSTFAARAVVLVRLDTDTRIVKKPLRRPEVEEGRSADQGPGHNPIAGDAAALAQRDLY